MRRFQDWIRSLSPTAEFLIVVIGAFGLPTATSVWLSFNVTPAEALRFTDADLHVLVIDEAVTLIVLVWFLRVRGWSVDNFGPYPSWGELAQAFGLAIACFYASSLPWEVLAPRTMAGAGNTGLSIGAILAASIINPLFEELFLCAYMVPMLAKRWGIGAALVVSLAVRLSFHTYQGPIGVLAIALIGLILTGFYARTRRLWPVVIAHGLLDYFGLVYG